MKYSNMVRLKRRSHPLLLMLKSSVPSSISLVRGFLRASAHIPVAFSGACEGWKRRSSKSCGGLWAGPGFSPQTTARPGPLKGGIIIFYLEFNY